MSAFAGFRSQIKALSALGVILPALALGGCDQSTAEKSEPLRPVLVAQVKFSEWTRDGKLRQPVFLGLREDKEARAVRREEADDGG